MSIEAMKQALEALEWFDTNAKTIHEIQAARPSVLALRQAIARAEGTLEAEKQESVGEAYLCEKCHTPFDGAWECPSCGHNTSTKEAVYTHPYVPTERQPKREFVGLTVDEMAICIDEPAWDLVLRKAEQILKEKNT